MKPSFALSLSVDGIVLLHRVPDGWHHVGKASLESTDLAADMARLRDTATSLDAGGLQTKLILPNDQIRYMTIETARTSVEDIHREISAATPVPLDEMVIDFDRSGGRTHIAAVAKQTLLEAETFALEHGFEPISFVAAAESFTFAHEVFFGPTRYARESLSIGADLSREDVPPLATGTAVSGPSITQITGEDPALQDNPTKDAPEPDNTSEDELIEIPVFASRNKARTPDETQVDLAAISTPTPRPESNLKGMLAGLQTAEPDAPAIPKPVVADAATAVPVTPAPQTPRPKGRVKSRLPDVSEDSSGLLSQMGSTSRGSAVPVPKTQADMVLAKGMASTKGNGKPKYLGLMMTAGLLFIMFLVAMWASSRMENGIAGLFGIDAGLQEEVVTALPIAPAALPEAVPEPETTLADATSPPAEDDTAEVPPTPIVTAIPGRVLSPADAARIYAATGVWQRAPRLPDLSQDTTLDGIYSFATLPPVQDIAKPGRPDLGNSIPDLRIISPQNPAPVNRPLPRDEDGFIRASATGTILPTGVWIYGRAPSSRPPLRPTDEPVGLDDASVPNVQETIIEDIQNVSFTSDVNWPTGQTYGRLALSQPLALSPPLEVEPELLEIAEALTAPPPAAPALPGPDVVSDAPTTLIPAEATTQVPVTAALDSDPTPEQEVPERTAPLAAREDGFVAPETFVEVISGRPAIVPPLRPGTPETPPETDTADADTVTTPEEDVASIETPEAAVFQDPALANSRPAARPENLVVTPLQTFEAIPALAGSRPLVRPETIAAAAAPEAPAEVEQEPAPAADIASIVASIAAAAPPSQIINPSRSAIVASPRPDTRPQNFARVVASAQTLATRQQTRETAAATSAAAVPAAPAPAPTPAATPQSAPATGGQTTVTVARAATVDDAIRLRDMNLIGVYGKPGARRALIRLSNGRFVKVEVGSDLDGGRVTAIGDTALNFVKRGQTYALQLPAG